jgi:hypothetical protein
MTRCIFSRLPIAGLPIRQFGSTQLRNHRLLLATSRSSLLLLLNCQLLVRATAAAFA